MNLAKSLLVLSAILTTGCAEGVEPVEELVARAGAPLFEGMGDYHRVITTSDPGAQRYFNQGMVLAFGFNHAEAIRSFHAAQKLDNQCAMCYWGEALATGPNINVTSKGKVIMSPEERVAAYAAVQRAVQLKEKATRIERDLIDALSVRYNGDPETERDPLDRAYAQALRQVVANYPDDDDAAAMFAEAWMNTMPWNDWADDGQPSPETMAVIEALESILERSPRHPLAPHLYIHAVEASSNPGRAEAEAVYRKDLEDYPRNGWSMFGLIQSLEVQDKVEEAETVRQVFDQVWSRADVELAGSRM